MLFAVSGSTHQAMQLVVVSKAVTIDGHSVVAFLNNGETHGW